MSYQTEVYQILISSPSAVIEEGRIVFEEINKWNSLYSKYFEIVFLPVSWKTHSIPKMGGRSQELLNKQFVRSCDALIAMFWTRIGSSTGKAKSGTIEEIEELIALEKPVSLYFSDLPKHQNEIDNVQYEKLKSFKEEQYLKGLVKNFDSHEEFQEDIKKYFAKLAQKLKPQINLLKRIEKLEADLDDDIDFAEIYRQAKNSN